MNLDILVHHRLNVSCISVFPQRHAHCNAHADRRTLRYVNTIAVAEAAVSVISCLT